MSNTTPPCKGCPFRTENHRKRCPGNFYTVKNIRRLWRGVKDGETMICHATDPNAHETGSPAHPKPGQIRPGGERVCLGALALFKREEAILIQIIDQGGSYQDYVRSPRSATPAITRDGFLNVANAAMFAGTPFGPKIEFLEPDLSVPVSLPWEGKR